ncbi:MAG TPA: hypothetical protein PKA27_00900 [Fimbriimonadaceae bacterium]|nr:hypothetical protein [Fimbriimonadaceae bacterium]
MHWTAKVSLGTLALIAVSTSIANPTPQEDVKPPSVALQAKRVSVNFKNATLQEVTDWLSSHGLSYVMKIEPGDARLTINIVDQPLKDAANAIAEAMGGRWVQSGNVFTFTKGSRNMVFTRGLELDEQGLAKLKELKGLDEKALQEHLGKIKELRIDPKNFQGFTWEGKDMKPLDEKAMKELEQRLGKIKEFKFDPKEMKGFKFEGKEFKPFDEKSMKEFNERMEKWSKEIGKDGKAFVWDGKALEGFKMDEGLALRMQDLDKLMESITKDQWALHEKQGHLKWSDLTPAQQKMMGNGKADKNWSVSISKDGKTLNFKG